MIHHSKQRNHHPAFGGSRLDGSRSRTWVICVGGFLALCIGLLSLIGGRSVVVAVHDDHGHLEASPVDLVIDVDHHSHDESGESSGTHDEDHEDPDHHHHLLSSPSFDMVAILMPDAVLLQPVKRYVPMSSNDECPAGLVDELVKPPQRA